MPDMHVEKGSTRVMKRYAAIVQGEETVSDTPPKISLT